MMTRLRRLHVFRCATGLLLAVPLVVAAQTGIAPALPSVDPAASAVAVTPPPLRASPQVTSPSDARRSLDLNNPQPEGKVTPQVRIPLGKKGDTPIFQRRRPDATPAAAGNVINDGAARCEAQTGADVRARCREQVAREAPK